jgi:hypothetical protein
MQTSRATTKRLPTNLNSIDQSVIKDLVHGWRSRHGELRACYVSWEVVEDGPVRSFPAKLIDLYFANGHGQVRLDMATHKVKVTKDPNNKPEPAVVDVQQSVQEDKPYFGMTPHAELLTAPEGQQSSGSVT